MIETTGFLWSFFAGCLACIAFIGLDAWRHWRKATRLALVRHAIHLIDAQAFTWPWN